MYFQLNLLALLGFYGTDIRKVAEQLLEHNLYDFKGTDIHNETQIQQLLTKPILFSNKNKIVDLLQKNKIFF